jgi:hypothetical protein
LPPGMLRLRKRPPSDRPTINAGTPWSAEYRADLDELLSEGQPVREIASYLCRTVAEVQAKIAELRR